MHTPSQEKSSVRKTEKRPGFLSGETQGFFNFDQKCSFIQYW